MSARIPSPLNVATVHAAWQGLNKLVPLGPITGERDHRRRIRIMNELLERVGANESHRLMPLLHVLAREIEAWEEQRHALPEATPAAVLAHLMEAHQLKQADLAAELGGQSAVSAILNGKRELNTRQVKALARRFGVSPAVFL